MKATKRANPFPALMVGTAIVAGGAASCVDDRVCPGENVRHWADESPCGLTTNPSPDGSAGNAGNGGTAGSGATVGSGGTGGAGQGGGSTSSSGGAGQGGAGGGNTGGAGGSGGCTPACSGSTPLCENGFCVPCPPGTTSSCSDMNQVCVELDTDEQNCGGCENACAAGKNCTMGICCGPGLESCDSVSCYNLQTNPENCNTCGTVCADGTCIGGVC